MNNIRKILFTVFILTLMAMPTAVFAEGFAVYEWSANGVAMGEANMFGENDPSVLAYNPAAITRFDGAYASTGLTWVNPATSTTFKVTPANILNAGRGGTYDNNYSPAVVPYMYYAQKAGANAWWGLAIFSRFGNQIEYDVAWPGRYDTVYSGIKGVTIQPTFAFKISPKLSAGVGLDINYMGLNMKKATATGPSPTGDLYSEIDGDSIRLGWVASLMYDFTPNTSAALVYRAKIKHTMDADATFNNPMLNTKAHGSVTIPDSLTFGIGHKFNNDKTRIEFNAVWTNWGTYDRLTMRFDNALGVSSAVKDWGDAWRFAVGIEHRLSDKWSIMGGYVWDQSPVPDYTMDFTVPTGDRHRGSLGFKYRPNDRSEITLSYCAIWAGDRDVASHIQGPLAGRDFASASIHDGLTQVVSIGYTIKLK